MDRFHKGVFVGALLSIVINSVVAIVAKAWDHSHPPAVSGACRVVQDPDAHCGPGECVVEIRSPKFPVTWIVGHEHITLTSDSEISMSVGPVSKPTP